MMFKVVNIVGTRPNFIKISPIMDQFRYYDNISPFLIHTGQHYDHHMSELFFEELDIPKPDINLHIDSSTTITQISTIMYEIEKVFFKIKPDLLLVVGDVNSTIACTLAAAHMNIPIAHIEAGLRSFDRTMPEEINRLVTDQLATWLFTTELSARQNLLSEGIDPEKIFFVGNVMVDSIFKFLSRSERSHILQQLRFIENETLKPYALLTLHRPANVDEGPTLRAIFDAIQTLAEEIPIIFPVHPRTSRQLQKHGIQLESSRIHCLSPLGYLDFLHLMSHAQLVLTDSGGIQEETTMLGVPCLTLRENTERPITIQQGTNTLVGRDKAAIVRLGREVLANPSSPAKRPDLWDGHAAERIVSILHDQLCKASKR
jgi:UDP-N-acetylglucosamine 2-epimerase (non-hydrolysing)